MRLFLQVVPVGEAVRVVRGIAPPVPQESVPLENALHRTLAADIRADVDIPGFDRSTVDGYAVASTDTVGAGEAIPAMLHYRGRVAMGGREPGRIASGSCMYVPTGGVLPEGADAVAMIEYCEQIGDDVLIHRPVAPGENVVLSDEDFAAGELVLEKGRALSPRDIGVAAAAGAEQAIVMRVPKVGIISTGNELVPIVAVPRPGEVRDVNSYLCGTYVMERGCHPVYYGIIRDERENLATTLSAALEQCDLVLISGGSSKDERDNTAAVIADLGEVLVHGVAIAPGKPTIIGHASGKPVIGLPGHPASAYVVLVAIVDHLLAAMMQTEVSRRTVSAVLAENIPSAKGREDYIRVMVKDGRATPVFGKSGLLNTLTRSTGLVRVPAGSEGLEVGEAVEVIVW